ncbi:unnamed protein product [Caenorhabditis auriculariae]|uniref:Uncharacterized protein n=1 Tax=Caenorhabditis auriculariae TaxID=2777116 RepID=A0A8S1H196_9PELO|nr:unnamed protein product [Caenorhabditis auriculariae]
MVLSAAAWFIQSCRAKKIIKKRELRDAERITKDTAEAVMKNIRGIPFLMQAIQYSMETSYYRNIMSEIGDGIVRTSVIHTAPACTSILDTESKPDLSAPSHATPRNSAEEQWQPHGENWRNEQLRLSMERENANLLVFPYCESSPHRDSLNMEALLQEFSRSNSIRSAKKPQSLSKKIAQNQFQVRCIGMSASFIERFNESFRTTAFDQPLGS